MRRAGIICKREKGHLGAGGRGEVRMRMRGENNADQKQRTMTLRVAWIKRFKWREHFV